MNRLFNNLWKSLCQVDWGNEDDLEAQIVTYGISVIGTILFFFLFDVLFDKMGFIWLIGLVCCFMCGIVYVVLLMEDRQREKREKAFENAQQWNPPNVYSDNTFVDDEKLGAQHK